ncbi:MAG: type II toxin-antitoxin system RelE/ParE family toxin [Oculatellaceae cyanobacterium Prado106]|jgi:mRNA-degrading endonuclease RelE of RelBE toxin-antitoxin system|nr:type II toxin-antitoxin system RelE/ParE family toxin [Oculatellaceae cyanobacterium Prado106]
MSNETPIIQIRFTNDFQQQVSDLAKRYRKIRLDIQPIIEQLQIGEMIGDQVQGTGYTVFKVRIKNSNIQKGKSAGYRLIYHLESSSCILLLLIYSKSDKTDVTAAEIKDVIKAFYATES